MIQVRLIRLHAIAYGLVRAELLPVPLLYPLMNQQDGQAVELPDMNFNDEIGFDTHIVETQMYEYKPTRGQRDYLSDEIRGIWIRVVRHGDVIPGYKSGEAPMNNLSWDNERKVEIRITNKLLDSFDDSEEEIGE